MLKIKNVPLARLMVGALACAACTHTAETSAPRLSGIHLDHISPKVAAQDDFFLHVNGRWLEKTAIPPDQSNYGVFIILREQARDHLRAIVADLEKAPHLPQGSDGQKIRDFYQSFMDTKAIDARGLKPLADELGRIAALRNEEELMAYFAHAMKIGGGAPFGIYVSLDYKDPNRYVPFLFQGGLGLPDREMYLTADGVSLKVRQAYEAHIARMFSLAGWAEPKAAAAAILKLETNLAQRQLSRTALRDRQKTYNPMSLERLQQLAPQLAWQRYFAELGVIPAAASARPESAVAVVSAPSYLQQFGEVMRTTKLADWQAYLKWHLLTGYAPYLNETLAAENFAFYGTTLRGIQVQEERWERGTQLVDGSLGELLGKEYVKRHFKPEAKRRMEQMVENLRVAFRQSIGELDWMSAETKARAIEKLSLFKPKIGYPSKWRDYASLTIAPGDLVGNVMRSQSFEYHDNIARLGKPVDREEWHMSPQTVNAYYDGTRNEIVFPAAILQPPFFNLQADDAVNYGAIGAVIGHEMGHGFDDQGSRFNGRGEMTNWWTPADAAEFQKRTARLVEQFNRFEPLKGQRVNGELTLGENIGDLGGLTIANKAYRLSLHGKEAPVIDGFTGQQRFFVGFAQVWAWKYTPEELKQRLLTDVHAPGPYRVNGVVRNMPEFYEAFGVKEGQGMYLPPLERVKIW